MWSALPGITEKHGKGPLRGYIEDQSGEGATEQQTVRQGGGGVIRYTIEDSAAAGEAIVTDAGLISLVVELTSGLTDVKYNWSVVIADPGAGTAAVHTAGTTNAKQYDSLRLTITAPTGMPPVDMAVLEIICTVTQNDDGSNPAARISSEQWKAQVSLIAHAE